jgi:glycosyltransferase involved in cell wall biosynthesis
MIKNKTIAVVVPCYNEEKQIGMVIETMPDFVDRIVIINDKSKDRTAEKVMEYIQKDSSTAIRIENILDDIKPGRFNRANIVVQNLQKEERKFYTPSEVVNSNPEECRIILINHLNNGGKGAGIATGYKWAKDYGIDCVATMDGDGQMDPDELESLCLPIINEGIDYVKGNRLIHQSALLVIPKVRYLGNSLLSILTKLASGYWHVSDTQTGYTAISNKALNSLKLYDIYKSYGYPNDMLVKLNISFCTLKEVEIKPVYDIGEKSKMKIVKVIPTISLLLLKSFFKRLWIKYLFRDFHPLFILYHFSFILFACSFPLGIKIIDIWLIKGEKINSVTLMAFIFLFISAFQSFLFAMWMDIQDNERLQK